MNAISRLQTALGIAVVVLTLGLAAAMIGGLLLSPPPPPGCPSVEGRSLLQQTGTGPTAASPAVQLRQRAVGIAVRCNGRGSIRVGLRPLGAAVQSPCLDRDTADGSYVLSDLPDSSTSTSWQVRTRPGNRWSLVLTRPVFDSATWRP